MSNISVGITLTVLGVTITFLALGVLILLIVGLKAAFPVKNQAAVEEKAAEAPEVQPIEQAIAVAAAWWYLRQQRSASLGKVLEQASGPWRKQPR